jgi:hypothetical protein
MLRKQISTINEKGPTHLRQWGIGVAVIFFLTFLFFSSFIWHISYPLELSHGDAFLVNFILNHYVEIFTTGDWSSLSTLPMFYGFPHSLFFTEFYPVHGVVAYLLSFFTPNIFLISHVLILATVLFSMVSMYTFCWYVFRRGAPSIIGALIFVCNPFLMARFPDHALLLAVGWIPISLLFVERAIREPKGNSVFWLFLVLIAQLLTSSLHYSIFLTVILPLYIGIRIWQEKVPLKLFIHRGTVLGALLFALVTTLVGYLYVQAYGTQSLGRTIETSYSYSARVTDWLFTGPQNMVYGGLKASWADRFPEVVRLGIYSEQNLFMGIIPAILAIACVLLRKRIKQKKLLVAIFIIGLMAWVLSFGPQIVLADAIRVPGVYGFIYQINPLFSYLRVPARFGVFVFLAIGFSAAAVLSHMEKKMNAKVFGVLLVGVVVGILIEYWQKPIEVTRIAYDVQAAYAPLKSREDIKVILNLPIGNSISYPYPQARAEDLDAHYLLWALLLHDKQLLNGYSGFLPKEYYKRANALSIAFPTSVKLLELKAWGVGGIVLHRDEFNDHAEFERISEGLKMLGVQELGRTERIVIFDLATWKEAP